ncbi:hypothetical protein Fmac_025407 [Flemingia macrophylla]|uniref:VQ domain-containing protein n=1 Tax=Flemingia macrophylla TaxID=520843 RepID=A0ABD1LS52_9FABA
MKNNKVSRRDKKEIKVTYISSPVKVKASASNFRALVQELTGRYSNVAETMPMEEEEDQEHLHDHSERVLNSKSGTQQWNVAQGYLPHDEETNLLKPEYSEFLSRSLMEPFYQQHLQYDLMSFDMS